MYENEDTEDIEGITLEEYYKTKNEELFRLFSSNKRLKIDYSTVNNFLCKFDTLHSGDFFKTFKPPLVQEYFCQQLNFLLLIDFILSFFKVNDVTFNVQKINTAFIFDFFVKLGEFYSFMNYLDVDEIFIDYLKYMISLYSLQLRREVIEANFHYDIEILDNFFANEIMPKVFEEVHYRDMHKDGDKIRKFYEVFGKELKEYNKTVDYLSDEFSFVDNLFTLNYDWGGRPSIKVKTTSVEVMNPRPPPPMNPTNNKEGFQDNDNTSDDDDDDDDDYYYGGSGYRPTIHTWTPTIMKDIPNIEESDPNFKSHRNTFIFKNFQELKFYYDGILKEVRNICAGMKLKDYSSFLTHNDTRDVVKIKTILGVQLNFKSLDKKDKTAVEAIYDIACEYGHLEIVKDYIEFKSGELSVSEVDKAMVSPNREIIKMLRDACSRYKNLKNTVDKFKDKKFCEPKIRFNAV